MSAFKGAFDAPYRDELTRASKAMNKYIPQVMKIVADDFEFVPPATKKNPHLEKAGIRKIMDPEMTPKTKSAMPSYTGQRFGTKW